MIVTDGNLWVEQRRFVVRHLREFGFGRTSMASLIEEEAYHLIEHFKKLLQGNTYPSTIGEVTYSSSNYNKKSKDGQIYQLVNKLETNVKKEDTLRPMKLENVYVKAEDYEEIRRLSHPRSVVVSMHDAFGVPVLNTLWRMMAGRRYRL